MKEVEPIRDKGKLHDILDYLKKENERNYMIFLLGIYTALRISDILSLQVRQVRNKEEIRLNEQKTKKSKVIKINRILKKELEEYVKGKEDYEYLIPNNRNKNEPITRQQAYNIVKTTCKKFGIKNVGTHSLRKTFGYHYYNETKDIALLQNIFNHSEPSITLRYIGINQDTISDAYYSMRY